jgi:uncharacterized protein (TIGR03435 family)
MPVRQSSLAYWLPVVLTMREPLCNAQNRPGDTLKFEVASIRPTVFPTEAFAAGFFAGASGNPCSTAKLAMSGSLVKLTSAGICDLIRIAYDLKSYQIIGIPTALEVSSQDKVTETPVRTPLQHGTFFYDVQARSPTAGSPTEDEIRGMLRSLLADRFHLIVHRDRKALSYYALVVQPRGPKMHAADKNGRPQFGVESTTLCGFTAEKFAVFLNGYADKLVLDRTGLAGRFDYEMPFGRSGDFTELVASVGQYLGMKLESRKEEIEILVVDHVERPSDN